MINIFVNILLFIIVEIYVQYVNTKFKGIHKPQYGFCVRIQIQINYKDAGKKLANKENMFSSICDYATNMKGKLKIILILLYLSTSLCKCKIKLLKSYNF